MIPGDHDRPDPGLLTLLHSLRRFLPGRIHHGDHPDKGQMIFILQRQFVVCRDLFIGKSQHPQPFFGKFLILVPDLFLVRIRQWMHALIRLDVVHPFQQHIDRAFDKHGGPALHHMLGGHQLPVAVKRILPEPGIFFPDARCIESEPVSQVDQRELRRIPDLRPFRVGGVVAEDAAQKQHAFLRIFQVDPFRRDPDPVYIIVFHRHPVLGQSSRLIGTDDRHTAQPFHCLQLPDDGMLFRHLLRPEGKHDGHDRAQCFRDRRYRKGYSEQKGVSRVSAPHHLDSEQNAAEDQDEDGQLFPELIQADLQGCLLLRGLV